MFKVYKVIFLMCISFLLTSCWDEPEEQVPQIQYPTSEATIAPVSDATPTATQGGSMRISMRPPLTLNPLLNEDVTVDRVLQLMYEPLITFDHQLRPIPHLASLEFAFNGASAVVTIREDALWSNGTPITSDDLVYSIQTLQDAPQEAIYKKNIENISSLEVIDDRTVRVNFKTISGGTAYMFNFPIIKEQDEEATANGPYKLKSYAPMELAVLVRNPNSFRAEPYIDEIDVLIIPEGNTDLYAFDKNLIDVFLSEVPEWARHHSVKPIRHAEHVAMRYKFIGFNFKKDLSQDHRFRQAVAHALDIEGMIADVFLTHAAASRTPIHPSSWLSEQDIPILEQDMGLAKELANRVNQSRRSREQNEESEPEESGDIQIIVSQENIEGIKIARVVADQMNEIALTAEVEILPSEEYILRLEEGQFDMFVGEYNLSLRPDLSFALHSESPDNLISYNDPQLDLILEEAASAGTDMQFQRALSDMQIHIAQQLPLISLAFRHSAIITDLRVHGKLDPAPDNVFINIQEWFVVD